MEAVRVLKKGVLGSDFASKLIRIVDFGKVFRVYISICVRPSVLLKNSKVEICGLSQMLAR